MKVLQCKDCLDLLILHTKVKSCLCGKVRGKYNEDGDTVAINSKGKLLGFPNTMFMQFLFDYPVDNGKVTIKDDIE